MRGAARPSHCCVGGSRSFKTVMATSDAVARRRCTILLRGESGAGKELIAREIHRRSRRASQAFVPVDCTNLSSDLLASQLFGHVRGAFTGADHDTMGFFRAADGGTLFLDEISELPLGLQAKLLRVLQDFEVMPLGATKTYSVDVRVICATNRDLAKMVEQGGFRSDLYYRINVVSLWVPPLRERREDIIPLAEYFLGQQALLYDEPGKELLPGTKEFLLGYDWPGNVRELANAMEHAYVLSDRRGVAPADLPAEITSVRRAARRNAFRTLDEMTRQLVLEALEATHGRKMAAAALLGIERRRLNRIVSRLNVRLS